MKQNQVRPQGASELHREAASVLGARREIGRMEDPHGFGLPGSFVCNPSATANTQAGRRAPRRPSPGSLELFETIIAGRENYEFSRASLR